MTPRHLGCVVVIAKSFARIHETNLKKQGVLALVFENSADYDKVQQEDKISILGLDKISEGMPVKCILHHKSGSDEILLRHSATNTEILLSSPVHI